MDPLLIAQFIILFMLSGFFSGTEIALMSIASHKIDSLTKKRVYGSKALKYIKERNDSLLITILIGNNLVNVYTAALATKISIEFAANNGHFEEATAIGISTGIVTFLLLVFGEITPKSFATKNAEKISLFVAPIYKFLMYVFYPVNFLLEKLIRIFTGGQKINKISEDEISAFIDLGKEDGTLSNIEHNYTKNVLDMGETTAEEIMTPRVKMEMISSKATVKEAISFFMAHTHSRIPVYGKTIDNVKYVLSIRELLEEKYKGNLSTKLKDLKFTKILKVPLNQSVMTILETFKKSRKHIAIVIDEYGGVAGLLTIEDILEEIVGEIRDESDREEDEVKKIGKNSLRVDSIILFQELLDNLDIAFIGDDADSEIYDGETVSYVITEILGRFPNPGEIITLDARPNSSGDKFEHKILNLKVLGISEGKIDKVEATLT